MTKPLQDAVFLDHFSDLEDPRIDRRKLYTVSEILLLTLCAVIAGCDGWADIEAYGKAKAPFLRRYLSYDNGTPSDDTLRRFFRALDPNSFRQRFIAWAQTLTTVDGQVIAIDGKTQRRSFDGDKDPLHLVSAFATEARLVLGQLAVREKTNEITAIPELLEWLDCRGAIVTIDAMGCQVKIAEKIIEKGGAYALGLKKNQPELYTQVEDFFTDAKLRSKCHSTDSFDGGHGRIETRSCYVTEDIEWLFGRSRWKGLRSIAMIESTRETNSETGHDRRYYLTSLDADPAKVLKATRCHWAVENNLHWVLDMSFGEDQSRIRKGNAPENIGIIRHSAINLITAYKKPRQTIRGLRKQAGWNDDLLAEILKCVGNF